MKIKKDRAIKELDQSIEWFSLKKFDTTTSWLEFIKKNIQEGNPTDYDGDIQDVFSAYKQDYEKKGEYKKNCSVLIQSIYLKLLEQGLDAFQESFEDTYEYYRSWRVTQANLTNISELARDPSMSEKARYYLYCFVYLIAVEGSYSNWIKIFYSLVCKIEGIKMDLDAIKDWLPKRAVEKLGKISSDFDILFDGYHEGTLRNAIGHGDFSYDDESKKMNFKHIWQGTIKLDLEWSFEEFYENLSKIMSVSDIGLEIIWLLRLLSYKHFFI